MKVTRLRIMSPQESVCCSLCVRFSFLCTRQCLVPHDCKRLCCPTQIATWASLAWCNRACDSAIYACRVSMPTAFLGLFLHMFPGGHQCSQDGRDVGYPLQLKASYTGTMPLHVFLDTVGLHLPDPDRLWISGSVGFCQDTRQITVTAGDVVVLLYGVDRIGNDVTTPTEPLPIPSAPTSTVPADPPGGTLSGPSSTQISDRSRSPGVGHAAGRRAGAEALDQPRDSADLYQLCLQHGIAPYLVFPVAAAVRRMQLFDLRLQLLTSASHFLPLVYQDGPLSAPPAESDTEGTSSPAADDSSRSPLASAPALPELKSVRVAVATFQGPTRYYSLWTQDGEDLAGFLVRAEILINDDASFLILLPVDPQPSLPQLSLLLCPRWWALVGILPCMVQGPCAASQPFMLVAHQDQTVQDCLPQDILPATGSAIVAVSPGMIPSGLYFSRNSRLQSTSARPLSFMLSLLTSQTGRIFRLRGILPP